MVTFILNLSSISSFHGNFDANISMPVNKLKFTIYPNSGEDARSKWVTRGEAASYQKVMKSHHFLDKKAEVRCYKYPC